MDINLFDEGQLTLKFRMRDRNRFFKPLNHSTIASRQVSPFFRFDTESHRPHSQVGPHIKFGYEDDRHFTLGHFLTHV